VSVRRRRQPPPRRRRIRRTRPDTMTAIGDARIGSGAGCNGSGNRHCTTAELVEHQIHASPFQCRFNWSVFQCLFLHLFESSRLRWGAWVSPCLSPAGSLRSRRHLE
jgi:hypothetical protein